MKIATLIATGFLFLALLFFAPVDVRAGDQNVESKPVNCKTTRAEVAERRSKAWKWQEAVDVPRSPTKYAERRTVGCGYLLWLKRLWNQRVAKHYKMYVKLQEPVAAIKYVFGRYASQALGVAWCESRYSVWAENGQYLGLFQMGSSERRMFGHGNTALEQARAAHRYFVLSGRDWSPWACRWAAY